MKRKNIVIAYDQCAANSTGITIDPESGVMGMGVEVLKSEAVPSAKVVFFAYIEVARIVTRLHARRSSIL